VPARPLSRGLASAASAAGGAGAAPERAVAALRRARAVAFDVDSTVITSEGIDELAEFLGKGAEVAALTKAAMGGKVAFRDALEARLSLLRPSRARVDAFLRERPAELTPGLERVFAALRARGAEVFLVSGGFEQMIAPVAARLCVPPANLFANRLLFEDSGEYRDFDRGALTSRDGGKAEAVLAIKARLRGSGGGPDPVVVMVGDGATDLQARPPADAFVGFGGVVTRDVVRAAADLFVQSWEPVIEALEDDRR